MVSPILPSQPIFSSGLIPSSTLGVGVPALVGNPNAALPLSTLGSIGGGSLLGGNLTGGSPTGFFTAQSAALPFSTSSLVPGSNSSGALNSLLASLPFSNAVTPLNTINTNSVLNTLSLTNIGGINPFTGSLQSPFMMSAAIPLTTLGTTGGGVLPPGQIENNPQLQNAISLIQQVPEAADLLQTALNNGYSIRVGDPSDGTEPPGVTTEGITNSGPNGKEIIISPNAKDFIKTLVHETYHAATESDGDSKNEEAMANIIGDRVSALINGRSPRDPQQIFAETFPLYPDLPLNN